MSFAKKRLVVVFILLVLFGFSLFKWLHRAHKTQLPVPLTQVEVMTAKTQAIYPDIKRLGTVTTDHTAILYARTTGYVTAINFRDGAQVKKGEVLLKLSNRGAQAQVQSAKAKLEIDNLKLRRNQPLYQSHLVSKETYDELIATVKQDKATLIEAQEGLAKTQVRAPVDGIVTARQVNVGDYVTSSTVLFKIVNTQVLKLSYSVPSSLVGEINPGMVVNACLTAKPTVCVKAIVDYIAPEVDSSTRTLALRARLQHDSNQVLPGMSVIVKQIYGKQVPRLFLPEQAVTADQGLYQVYSVNAGKATKHQVMVGERQQGQVEIMSGIKAGQVIIINGQEKVKSGDKVKIVAKG